MSTRRIYVDTSVIGGCFDEVFRSASRRIFERARAGELTLLVGTEVTNELARAPDEVRQVLDSIPRTAIEYLLLTVEITALRDAYLAAGVVGSRSQVDATHVAFATVARADAIVSWNFRPSCASIGSRATIASTGKTAMGI